MRFNLETKQMDKSQFNLFIKFLDIKKTEFAKLYGINKHTVYKFTRQCRKIAESVAKSKGFKY